MAGFEFWGPTRLVFGAGALARLGDLPLPGRRALLVASRGRSTRALGYLGRVEAELDRAEVAYVPFERVEPNPLRATINEGGAFACAEGCDFVLALGGGSVMDAAKGMAVVAAVARATGRAADVWDFVVGGTAAARPIPVDPLPVVCVPTTAGTGSEVDSTGIVSQQESNEKLRLTDKRLSPRIALVDPELTLSVPPALTAYQGFDALFHCIECHVSTIANPMGSMLSLEGIRAGAAALPTCVADGSNLEARTQMSWAATLGGLAMVASGTTGCHALEHAMSAHHHEMPHGAGLITISGAYHAHMIGAHACDERYVAMARLMGRPDATEPEEFLDAYEALRRACGVEGLRMGDWGLDPSEFDDIARTALLTTPVLFVHDPAPLSQEDVVAILQASWVD